MKKIGRNDQCPCGSGRKYKYCCLNSAKAEKDKNLLDICSFLHSKCIELGLINDANANIDVMKIYGEFCNSLNMNSDDVSKINIDFIEKYIRHLEELIIDLCCKYSSYEMFFWFRRIKPINRFNSKTAFSYHELMKLAILSYGTKNDTFTISNINGIETICPKYIASITSNSIDNLEVPVEMIPILCTVYKLETVCFYYIYVCNCHRIAQKGGKYLLDKEFGFQVSPKNEEIEFLIRYYDLRLSNQTLLSKIGTTSTDKTMINPDLLIMTLQYNFNDELVDGLNNLKFNNKDDRFNFIPGKISVEDYYHVLRNFNPLLMQKFGFEIEDILSFVIYFSRSLISKLALVDIEPENTESALQAVNVLQRGYFLIENSTEIMHRLIEAISTLHKKIFGDSSKTTTKKLLNVFNYLLYSDGNEASFQEKMLHGFMMIKITNSKYLVDCTSSIYTLQALADNFRSIDGYMGNIISKNLEDKTNKRIKEIFGEHSIYTSGEIKNSRGEKKEIDSSFILNDCLILFECKSLSVSEGTIIGTSNALAFRQKKMEGYLIEVEEKADFIKNNVDTISITLPSNVIYIAPLVITSFPEYIWEMSDRLFITNDLGRILLLDDIEQLHNNHELYFELLKKPYIRKIEKV